MPLSEVNCIPKLLQYINQLDIQKLDIFVGTPFSALMTGKLWLNSDSSLFSGAEMSKFGSMKKCQK
jgi:hypothetical protein